MKGCDAVNDKLLREGLAAMLDVVVVEAEGCQDAPGWTGNGLVMGAREGEGDLDIVELGPELACRVSDGDKEAP